MATAHRPRPAPDGRLRPGAVPCGTLSTDDEEVEQQVAARMARQRIFDRPDPPNLWSVLDEAVLHRFIGPPKITYDQLIQLADMSMRSYICVQIVPADTARTQAWLARSASPVSKARRTFSTWMQSKVRRSSGVPWSARRR
jgi:hypothetical protein